MQVDRLHANCERRTVTLESGMMICSIRGTPCRLVFKQSAAANAKRWISSSFRLNHFSEDSNRAKVIVCAS